MKNEDTSIGIVNFVGIDVYSEPNEDSDVICKIGYMGEVIVDLENSTANFYKICSVIGAEGFCKKEYIIFK